MKLSDEQNIAIDLLIKKVTADRQATLGGYAGTGKSTVITELKKLYPNYAVAAYTGKAANVLRQKGLPATTIHSLIYKPVVDSKGNVEFILNDTFGASGVIIDEASMVSKEIYNDLRYFDVPLIFVGDHGQLPPVSETAFNIMEHPDVKLETVHRNAGDIALFAEHIRKGGHPRQFPSCPKVNFIFNRFDNRFNKVLVEADQVICAFNKTRVETNAKIRKMLGYEDVLHCGERIMCLRNSRKAGLFNGMQGIALSVIQERWRYLVEFEANDTTFRIDVDLTQFGKEKPDFDHDPDAPHPFEYAYCATCHKCQGDEKDHVVVLEQKCKHWDHKRWAYTAASRAKEKLTWVLVG